MVTTTGHPSAPTVLYQWVQSVSMTVSMAQKTHHSRVNVSVRPAMMTLPAVWNVTTLVHVQPMQQVDSM